MVLNAVKFPMHILFYFVFKRRTHADNSDIHVNIVEVFYPVEIFVNK